MGCHEAASGFVPIAGEYFDFRAAITGTDINGRELGTWQRATAGAMGALGTASIGLSFFTGGLSLVGFRALRGALATRKAVKIAKLAEKGVQSASLTKSIKLVDRSRQEAEALKKLVKISKTQRKAMKAKRMVRAAQRSLQATIYLHLGWQLGSMAYNTVGHGAEYIEQTQQRALEAIERGERFVAGG